MQAFWTTGDRAVKCENSLYSRVIYWEGGRGKGEAGSISSRIVAGITVERGQGEREIS